MPHNDRGNADQQLIQCGACFRSFETPAQFGQHARICREGEVATSHVVPSKTYQYAFLETQINKNLEIKSRFVIEIAKNIDWGQLSKKAGITEGQIRRCLLERNILNVSVSVRRRHSSGLITVNFMVRGVGQNPADIHAAKLSIEQAAEFMFGQLPPGVVMREHLCTHQGCRALVIRDTEGFCSRHRAQKYHKKTQRKMNHVAENEPQAAPADSVDDHANDNQLQQKGTGDSSTLNDDELEFAARLLLSLRSHCLQQNAKQDEQQQRALVAAQCTPTQHKHNCNTPSQSCMPVSSLAVSQNQQSLHVHQISRLWTQTEHNNNMAFPEGLQSPPLKKRRLNADGIDIAVWSPSATAASLSSASLSSLSSISPSSMPSVHLSVGFPVAYVPITMNMRMQQALITPITFVPVAYLTSLPNNCRHTCIDQQKR